MLLACAGDRPILKPMKTRVLKKKLVDKLANIGLEIRPASPVDKGVSRVASLGAKVVNGTQRAVRDVRREAEKVAESARATVHEATKPKAGKAGPRAGR
ncbi:MAG: hypothetical protein NTV51_02255 [Verrucomicrobia bacterium]|nr:hypothetical protein [Verrucomicrobiota bacterium]